MKKIFASAPALMMISAIAACGNVETAPPDESTPVSDEAGENATPNADPLWEIIPGTMWLYACRLLGIDVILNISTG